MGRVTSVPAALWRLHLCCASRDDFFAARCDRVCEPLPPAFPFLSLMSIGSPVFRRRLIYVVAATVLAAGVWYFGFREEPPEQRYPRPAWAGAEWPGVMPVRTVKAEERDLAVHLKAVGTVTPLNTVTVQSQVEGRLLRIAFEEGQQVEKGQLLAEIDPDTYRIQLAQAEGQQQQNLALLETARRDLERYRELHQKTLVTDQQLEAQQSLVRQREGAVASDQAQVDDARLQLEYTRIVAPISGRLGLRRIDPGNLVRANSTEGIVVITQTQPIAVEFAIPEINLQDVIDPLRAGETLKVEAWDRSERKKLADGFLRTVDNQIDPQTGTLRLKAEFPNENEQLFPNQFVNVRLRVRTISDAVVIPSAAVQFGSRGTYVYVIDQENLARVRDVVLGPVEGENQAINEGLEAGESVVLEGIDRLREGRKVIITNETERTAAR